MRALMLMLTLGLSCYLGTGKAQQLEVGVAKRIITPNPLLPVSGGIGKPSPVTQKLGELYARAIVLVKDSVKVAIVNIDNLGWPAVLGDKSRALIPHIPADHILIGATHTHSAPDAYGFPDENGVHHANLAYLDSCVVWIAQAVNEAYENRQPAGLRIATGKALGKIAFNYYAEDLYDPRCGVIQAISLRDSIPSGVIATLVNYAIHPEVLGANRGVLSPDLCGPLYDHIEEQTGGMALFMNGALGGMVTADNRDSTGKSIGTWEECERIGTQLASEALRIISDAPIVKSPQLRIYTQTISFPIESPMMQTIMELSPLGYEGEDFSQISTRLNLMILGNAKLLSIPGEALPNIGYFLKRKMDTHHPFLLGLTQDAFGYILSPEDYNSFEKYAYITRTSLGENTGKILITEALKMLAHAKEMD
ncbi:MAG: hypothetical protein AAF694_12465 [Bacteroidota bacterium]